MSDIPNKNRRASGKHKWAQHIALGCASRDFYFSCFKEGNKKITEYLIIEVLIFNHKTDYGN
jgi:hypothetical protein